MRPSRPAGFEVLSGCFFLCACAMAFALADGGDDFAFRPAGRLALAVTGALALVAAEALAFVRPWAFRASLAFAGSFAVTIFVVAGSDVGLAITAVVALPILIALSMVYNGLRPAPAARPGPRRVRVPRTPPSSSIGP